MGLTLLEGLGIGFMCVIGVFGIIAMMWDPLASVDWDDYPEEEDDAQ